MITQGVIIAGVTTGTIIATDITTDTETIADTITALDINLVLKLTIIKPAELV